MISFVVWKVVFNTLAAAAKHPFYLVSKLPHL